MVVVAVGLPAERPAGGRCVRTARAILGARASAQRPPSAHAPPFTRRAHQQ